MTSRTGPRILTLIAVVTMIASAIGFVLVLVLNAFVFDEYDRYGEISIPGSSTLQLPAGDVTVTFHTVLIGGSGAGLPVPPLSYRVSGPDGADATLTEDYGTTTTVNNDARVRIGYLHVPVAGDYAIELDGNVSAYLNPTLAFGRGSSYGHVPWILAAVFGLAVVDLVAARIWAASVRRRGPVDHPPPPRQPTGRSTLSAPPGLAYGAYAPTAEGIRIEQLNTLARLRDSGALTEGEYQSEKKRVLDGL